MHEITSENEKTSIPVVLYLFWSTYNKTWDWRYWGTEDDLWGQKRVAACAVE